MNMKNAALAFVIILVLAVLIISMLPEEKAQIQVAQNGTASPIEFGRAGDYGYLTFAYNGSGNVSLIALSEPPKTRIIVFKKDYLNTERYSYFMDELRKLEQKGFSISEVESIGNPNNSIIIIPSGAMPLDILERIDSLCANNKLIYIGKSNLIFSNKMIQFDWFNNISNFSKSHIIIIEKSLDEFYSDKNFTIFSDIERNSWAVENFDSFQYSGEGVKTIFLELRNASWLRMLPAYDSAEFPRQTNQLIGKDNIFPWEKISLTFSLNSTSGISNYTVEKDGSIVTYGELDRVRGEEAFFIPLSFSSPGDYLVRVSDRTGTLGAKRIHVKELNLSLTRSYGNFYEFSIMVDGKPVDQASITIGLSHSPNNITGEVRNGKIAIRANLRQGNNTFVITLFGKQHLIPYNNNQESILQFYVKYLMLGAVLISGFYLFLRMNRKPVYKILVPESVQGRNPELRVSTKDILFAFEESERVFGWNKVPLYARELCLGLKKLTSGMEVNEGNIEAVMKKLEEKGIVKSHLGLYSLSSWGNPKQNALRRIIRDKLVQNGIAFSEKPGGFKCKDWNIVFSPEMAGRDSIVVFEDVESKRVYLSSLDAKKRASLELKITNGVLRLVTLDELDGLL